MKLVHIYYLIPFIVALLAQWIKLIIDSLSGKKKSFHSFFTSGGMPSAHSTLTSSLLTIVIIIEKWFTELSMIVMVFPILVWYDAANVRYESWKHAKYINSLKEEMHKVMTQSYEEYIHPHTSLSLEVLKERLWHTPIEVFVGIVFGISVTLILVTLIDSNLIHFASL